MKRILDTTRMVIVSFECLFVIGIFVAHHFKPNVFHVLGETVMSNADVIKWIPAIPLALCGLCFSLAWKLTTPLSGSNAELFEWPDYWRLKLRRNCSLVLASVCGVAACSLWIFSRTLTKEWIGIIFILALGVSLINAGCMVFASFVIREILEQNQSQSKGH